MTDKDKLRYLWAFMVVAFLVFCTYCYLHRTGDTSGSLVGFGCAVVFVIVLTVMLVKQFHRTDKAKSGMIKAMAEHYHVPKNDVMVVDRIAYIDFPDKKEMLKINLVSLDKTMIKEH